MNDPDGFLSRWSRRKREAAEAKLRGREAAKAEESIPTKEIKDKDKEAKEFIAEAPLASAKEKPEPAFDLSKLPPIESITAATDIRPFLATGVPAELTRAALRRVWSTDPKIRDFIEIAENQWDFNAGTAIPAFDFSPPSGDLKRMVAEIFGKEPAQDPAATPESSTSASTHEDLRTTKSSIAKADAKSAVNEPRERLTEAKSVVPAQQTVIATHENDSALQKDDAPQNATKRRARRGHGGAMPR